MATSIKSASRRYTAQVEADGIMISVTGWGSHTPRPNAYGMFAQEKNIWTSATVSQNEQITFQEHRVYLYEVDWWNRSSDIIEDHVWRHSKSEITGPEKYNTMRII